MHKMRSSAAHSTPPCLPVEVNPGLVDVAVRLTARRYRLAHQDVEDLRSTLWVKLLDRDQMVLRRFAGRSHLTTYLVQVASRVVLDGFVAQFGRWRPTAETRRLGPAAVAWARLVERDSHSPTEAIGILRAQRCAGAGDLPPLAALQRAGGGRRFHRRRFVDVDGMGSATAATGCVGSAADVALSGRAARRQVGPALRMACRSLTARERHLLHLRFRDGLRISEIASRVGCRAVPLYREYGRILRKMREALAAAGVDAGMVAAAFEPHAEFPSSLERRPLPVPNALTWARSASYAR